MCQIINLESKRNLEEAVRFIKDDLYNSWNQYAMANGKAFKETAENKSDIIQAFSCLLGEFKEKIEKLLV